MIPPKDIIEWLFGIKVNKKANLIINLSILLIMAVVFFAIKKASRD
jgi:hypothetical protein